MKSALAFMGFIAGMIGLLGIGILAMSIGKTWDSRNTDALVTGFVAVCAGGAVVVGAMLALVVGVPLALRAYERRPPTPTPTVLYPPNRQLYGAQGMGAPQLPDGQGSWQQAGQYDLWDEAPLLAPPPPQRQWRE